MTVRSWRAVGGSAVVLVLGVGLAVTPATASTVTVTGVPDAAEVPATAAGGANDQGAPAAVEEPVDCEADPRWGGGIHHARIEGDVRAVSWCTLSHVAITGDLYVDTVTHIASSTVMGDVYAGGPLNARGLTVWGGIHMVGDAEVFLDQTTVIGSIRGAAGAVTLDHSRVKGAINATFWRAGGYSWRGLKVTRSQVDGWVNLHRGHHTFAGATFRRGLTASAPHAVRICGSHVEDDVTVRWAHGPTVSGSRAFTSAWGTCDEAGLVEEPSTIGGSMSLVDNPHSILLRHLTVAGDLECHGNTGPRGIDTHDPTVTVLGTRSGQCAMD